MTNSERWFRSGLGVDPDKRVWAPDFSAPPAQRSSSVEVTGPTWKLTVTVVPVAAGEAVLQQWAWDGVTDELTWSGSWVIRRSERYGHPIWDLVPTADVTACLVAGDEHVSRPGDEDHADLERAVDGQFIHRAAVTTAETYAITVEATGSGWPDPLEAIATPEKIDLSRFPLEVRVDDGAEVTLELLHRLVDVGDGDGSFGSASAYRWSADHQPDQARQDPLFAWKHHESTPDGWNLVSGRLKRDPLLFRSLAVNATEARGRAVAVSLQYGNLNQRFGGGRGALVSTARGCTALVVFGESTYGARTGTTLAAATDAPAVGATPPPAPPTMAGTDATAVVPATEPAPEAAAAAPEPATVDVSSGPLLAIDFGTTFTAAAVRAGDGTVTTVTFDDGQTRVPSGVLLPPGTGPVRDRLVVGAPADAQAAMFPAGFEATPKRRIGLDEVTLSGEAVAVVDMVAAVLAHVAGEAARHHEGVLTVVLTHPADWRSTRLGVLVDAAERAGLGEVRLLPEPVAAAAAYASAEHIDEGALAAVYDLGGGTFDVAVVERTSSGWEPAGPPAGIDPLGGVDFDRLLLDHIGRTVAERHPDVWATLHAPPADDVPARRHARELRREVRAAKEALSSHASWTVFVPIANDAVTVTTDELEDLLGASIDRSIEALLATIAAAGIRADDLAAVFLTGGSSRIPLVHRKVWDAVGTEPRTRSDPKLVVPLGALS